MLMLTAETKSKVNQLLCELSDAIQEKVKSGIIDVGSIESLARLMEASGGVDVPERVPVVGFISPSSDHDDDDEP